MAVQREKGEQQAIVKLLRSLGATVYVIGTRRRRGDYQGTMMSPGLPDLEVFLPMQRGDEMDLPYGQWKSSRPRPFRFLKIEVKAPGGRLRPEQRVYQELCAVASVDYVVGGLDDVIAWLIAHRYLRSDQVSHGHLKKAAS